MAKGVEVYEFDGVVFIGSVHLPVTTNGPVEKQNMILTIERAAELVRLLTPIVTERPS